MSDPLRISWSALSRYEKCHQHQLRKQEGKALKSNGRVFLPGTVADRCMRSWLREDNPRPGGMVAYIDEHLSEHSGSEAEYRIKWRGDPRVDRAEIVATVTEALNVLEPILAEIFLPLAYQEAVRFAVPLFIPDLNGSSTAVELVGEMDLLTKTAKDNYGVWDLKITKDPQYAQSVLGQLIFYAVATEILIKVPGQPTWGGFLTPLCKPPYIPVTISEADRTAMKARIIAYAHGAWRDEWDPRVDDDECWNCDCKHACQKFAFALTSRDKADRKHQTFMELAEARRQVRLRAGQGESA